MPSCLAPTCPAWHFLTGSPEKVNEVIAAWDMWVKSDPTGVLDHPSRIFLLDPRGRQREIYNLEFLKPETVLEDVRELLSKREMITEDDAAPSAQPRPSPVSRTASGRLRIEVASG